jgi:predicted MFS family arabinose efflux permease
VTACLSDAMSESPGGRPRAATIVLGLGTLVSHGFGLSLIPAMLPKIEDSFDSGFAALGAAVAAGLVAYAIGGLAASRVLDWLPNRTVLNSTFIVTGAALIFGATAASPFALAVPVALLGVVAPISWAATTHLAARTVSPGWRSLVMGGAAGGVGLGVIVNGGLVHLFSDLGEWRIAFVIAAMISFCVVLGSLALFRTPIDRPSTGIEPTSGSRSYLQVLQTWPGRVVVVGSSVAGVGTYTFNTFLTTTAIQEMGSSATSAGALLWIMGAVGVVASLMLGRLGDRRSPTLIIAWMFLTCGVGIGIASGLWSYLALVVGVVGVAILNYPVWGLVAAVATNRFEAPDALAAVSMGLVGASTLSAAANIASGQWVDAVGNVRIPYAALAVLTFTVGMWLMRNYRLHVAD